MYVYGKKIFAVSQKEDAVTKKKQKKQKKHTVISPGSSWSILQSLSQENKQVQMESASSDTLNY